MKTTKQISAVFLSTLMLSSGFLDCGDILSINKCEAIVRRVVVRKRVVKKPAENINTQQSSSNNSNTYSNTDNYNPDSNTGGNPNNYNTNDNATSNTSSNANNNANNNASSNTGIGDSNRDTRWNIVGGNEPENKKTDTNANNQLRTEDLNLTYNIRLGLVTDKESVAQRYVDVYADSALTRKYSNRWIDKGENYSVIQEYGNTLYVQYYSSSGEKRTGYVSNLIRTAQENTTEKILKGDVNGDGKVSITDLSLLKLYLTGNPSGSSNFVERNADVNGDGQVTLTDLSQLKQLLLSGENNTQNNTTDNGTQTTMSPVMINEGLYSLQPACAPNMELTVEGASKQAGANVFVFSKNSHNHTEPSHQKWRITRLRDYWYKIEAENSNYALNIHNGYSANGTNVSIWPYGGRMHEFMFYNAGNGYYYIQGNVPGSYMLDVSGGGNANGTNVQMYEYNATLAQRWKLVRVNGATNRYYIEPVSRYKQLPDGWYSIKSVNAPSKGLDVYQGNTSNGSNIILYDYNGQDNQKFYLKNQGDGTFTLKAGNCDLYLDAANGSSSNSTNIQLYQGNGTNAQKWKLVDANNNQFYIESNLRTKLSFDCANGGSENGTNIQLWDRGNVAWNKWIFSMVEGPVKKPITNTQSINIQIPDTTILNKQKVKEFISDDKWKHGVTWGYYKKPCIAKQSKEPPIGCAAYCADFAAYVYGVNTYSAHRSGEEYTDIQDIRAGDVVHIFNHWLVVLERHGNVLDTISGNLSEKVQRRSYTIEGNTLKDQHNQRSFDVGYHHESFN